LNIFVSTNDQHPLKGAETIKSIGSFLIVEGLATAEVRRQRRRDGGDLEQDRRLLCRASQVGRGSAVLRKSKER